MRWKLYTEFCDQCNQNAKKKKKNVVLIQSDNALIEPCCPKLNFYERERKKAP